MLNIFLLFYILYGVCKHLVVVDLSISVMILKKVQWMGYLTWIVNTSCNIVIVCFYNSQSASHAQYCHSSYDTGFLKN